MERNTSFFWNTDSLLEDGEYKDETQIGLVLEEGEADPTEHAGKAGTPQTESSPLLSPSPPHSDHRMFLPHSYTYNRATALSSATPSTIRFQVVLWYVGAVDVVHGHVPMRFRVTLFWNDNHPPNHAADQSETHDWKMEGRMLAFQCPRRSHQHRGSSSDDNLLPPVQVPPLSILNAVNHSVIGSPEITMMHQETRLMRWTCMYSATLFQGENLRVDNFPHDRHDLVLKLGILAHRRPGGVWDRRKWVLSLATEEDSQGSTRVAHGLVVDHVTVPNFKVHHGLDFEFIPLPLGSGERTEDQCLQVKLTVFRESRHYDKNIVPLLGVLNVVAISCLPRNFDSATASTETMLSIAFVEIGIRLTVDSRLPGVPYQIKMVRVMNRCFWLLCFLVLESNCNFFLVRKMGWQISSTDWIDLAAAIVGLIYTVDILLGYYGGIPMHVSVVRGKEKQRAYPVAAVGI